MKTLNEYLQYLHAQAVAREDADAGEVVSIAEFRDYAAQALFSARDGNDYAVFPDGDKFTMVVLGNNVSLGEIEAPTGQGFINTMYTGDDYQEVLEEVIQVMIYDNDVRGVYGSNYSEPNQNLDFIPRAERVDGMVIVEVHNRDSDDCSTENAIGVFAVHTGLGMYKQIAHCGDLPLNAAEVAAMLQVANEVA